MSSQTTVDNLSTRVDQLDISGRRSPEFTHSNGKLIFSPKTLTRDYILSHQPWDSISLPPQYVPMGKLRWFPPMFYLGVPLTLQEVFHFAKHLGLSAPEDCGTDMYFTVAGHLSQMCGFTGPDSSYPLHRVAVNVCDAKGRPWMLSLVNNYPIPEGLDYREPFTVMVNALDGAFGGSKRIEWWLEYWVNHSPKDFMWLRLKPEWVRGWDKNYDYQD